MAEDIQSVVLHETTQRRYLNYALSVITSRALPDVRDGLKPVQRRILYAMYHNLGLTPDSKHRKSAAVIGEVMAKYHPHGDQSIYDAMVRLAQDFSLRYPLVDGQGNFGSMDGDGAAAMRYTEAKLQHLAIEMLSELRKDTVPTRANYDGTLEEPVVLPAQVPNLLINGASGIAVGMATNIPPHHLGEVISGCVALIDNPALSIEDIVQDYILAPDFPGGPAILNTQEELIDLYTTGSGAIEMRGRWELEKEGRRAQIVITAIPYGLNKSSLIMDIAGHIQTGKVPQLIDIRDESTEDVRIVLELKRGANPDAAMAYLFKRTSLQTRFNANLTCLVPVDDAALSLDGTELTTPKRLDLKSILKAFLDFRYGVTRARLQYDLRKLEARIHILKGFAIIFNALDEAIQIIRKSEGKADARQKLMDRFELDYEQAEAILETKLYRLARIEIDSILDELREKETLAKQLRLLLGNDDKLWALIRDELEAIRDAYDDRRLSPISGPVEEKIFSEETYIVEEDAFCIVTRQGWFKRQKSYSDLDAIRVREGDAVGWVLPSTTIHTLTFFTNMGKAYTLRVADIAQTTGYGEPIGATFDFTDGEHIVYVASSDPRCIPQVIEEVKAALSPDDPPPPWLIAMSRNGRVLRVPFENFHDPSNRNGRTFMRLDDGDDRVVDATLCVGHEVVSMITYQTFALLFPVREVNILNSYGKGVQAIRRNKDDHVLGFTLTSEKMHGITVETDRGREEVIRPNKYSITSRGNRGRQLSRTGHIVRVERPPIEISAEPNDAEPPKPLSPNVVDDGQGSLV